MGKLVIIPIVFFVGAAWLRSTVERTAATPVASKSTATDWKPASCEKKRLCITVYIAPWCGVCQASEPTFHAFQLLLPKLRPDVGFGLVIGNASPTQNLKMKEDLDPIDSFADDSGSLMRTQKINAFPTWVIRDQAGNEVFRKAGGFQVVSESQIEDLLTQYFKI